ncbi:MAG: hypothetical protein ACT6S0_27035 [Roseateles sp.]|uniref:hypothetical protein n=1 Tax=Roseateles sp. TaxID=1971397 RepID=UPI0040375D19
MFRVLVVLVVACALSGCDKLTAPFTASTDRIGKAFPVSEEVQLGMSKLLASVAGDDKETRSLQEQYGRLLQVRALTCTAASGIGRFDTPSDIRKKIQDGSCFREQDAQLVDWVGLRRVSVLLGKPPLYPRVELHARQALPAEKNKGAGTVGIVTSAESNVALLKSGSGTFNAVRLPDGKPIQTFTVANNSRPGFSLSPNGRVLAAPSDTSPGLRLIEVETGIAVWSTDKYQSLVTWLASLNALVLIQSSQGQQTVIVDALNGKETIYPLAEKRATWALALPGDENRRLVGGVGSVAVMAHVREPDGALSATQVAFWRLARSLSSSSSPFLMDNGKKAYYFDARNLAWIDLASGEQGFWETSALHLTHGYAKLDETSILLASSAPGTYTSQGKMVDVQQRTVAPVPGYQPGDGILLPLTPRSGYMRYGAVTTIGGDDVEAGPPEDLQKAIAAAQLETQLAKLAPAAPAPDSVQVVAPLLTHVPQDAQVAVVGVYEAKGRARGAEAGRALNVVRVNVMPASTSLVLVLSSYEPVRWVIQNSGRKISAILISGYHPSEALGAGTAPILKIGSTFAYKMESAEYEKLKKDVRRYVSNPVRSFQGSYTGQDFSVSGF